jgi:hypothetical protein
MSNTPDENSQGSFGDSLRRMNSESGDAASSRPNSSENSTSSSNSGGSTSGGSASGETRGESGSSEVPPIEITGTIETSGTADAQVEDPQGDAQDVDVQGPSGPSQDAGGSTQGTGPTPGLTTPPFNPEAGNKPPTDGPGPTPGLTTPPFNPEAGNKPPTDGPGPTPGLTTPPFNPNADKKPTDKPGSPKPAGGKSGAPKGPSGLKGAAGAAGKALDVAKKLADPGKALEGAKQAAKAKIKVLVAAAAFKVAVILVPIALVALVAMVIVSSLGGGLGIGSGARDPDKEVVARIPVVYLNSYLNSAENHQVPWTVLAAIGEIATDHGRFGPLDADSYGALVDRDPDRKNDNDLRIGVAAATRGALTYQGPVSINACDSTITGRPDDRCTVVPAIGRGAEPKGPMLILNGAVPEMLGSDPQNPEDAIDFVAEQLSLAAEALIEAYPELEDWSEDAALADRLWALAVDEITGVVIGDPNDLSIKCDEVVSADQHIANLIKDAWRCEAQRAGTTYVVSSQLYRNGALEFTTMSSKAGRAQLTSEALTAAWRFSQWGKAACDNSLSGPQGVFPLTASQARGIDRCDKLANTLAAARLVIKTEAVKPELRRTTAGAYAPMLGGWRSLPTVFGNDLATLLSKGPYQAAVPGVTCTTSIDAWLERLVLVVPAAALNAPLPASFATAVEAVPSPLTLPSCSRDRMISLSLAESARVRASAIQGDIGEHEHPERSVTDQGDGQDYWDNPFDSAPGNFDNTDETSGWDVEGPSIVDATERNQALANLERYFASRVDTLKSYLRASSTSWLPRLSISGEAPNFPTPPPSMTLPSGIGYGSAVVRLAIALGGTFPEDERTAPDFAGGSSDPTDRQSLAAGITGAIGVKRIHPEVAVPSPWRDDFPRKNYSRCGNAANANHYARPPLVDAWERMCADAMEDGVNITIVSGTRTNAQQISLIARVGATQAARPAKPGPSAGTWIGGSPHEKGIGIDVATAEMRGLRWLHAIVGCFDQTRSTYRPLPRSVDFQVYAGGGGDPMRCNSSEWPVKRLQTYGFVVLCTVPEFKESWAKPEVIGCQGLMPSGFKREWWHIEIGEQVIPRGTALNTFTDKGRFILAQKDDIVQLTPEQLVAALRGAGWTGERLRIAWAVAMRESEGYPQLVSGPLADGSYDHGLFQVNDSRRRETWIKFNSLTEATYAASVALRMTDGGRDFGIWGLGSTGYALELRKNNPNLYNQLYRKWKAYYDQFPGDPSVPKTPPSWSPAVTG